MILRIIALNVLVLAFFLPVHGQYEPELEAGVRKHKGIDRIYRDFSEGYATLDAGKVAGLYTVNASYLSPSSNVDEGRPAILDNFERYFSNVKKRGQTMTISFRIEKRRIFGNSGYDIGVFEINHSKDGEVVNNSRGRFVVVTVKDADGKWRFDVDAYTPLEAEKETPS